MKTVLNTRAVHQAAKFDQMIRERGFVPLAYPCIAIQPPENTSKLDNALMCLADGKFDWLALTSSNTVFSLQTRLDALGISLDKAAFRVAAVGPATARSVQARLGLTVDLIPDDHIAEALAASLLKQDAKRVFLPESAIAPPTLADQLAAGGALAAGGVDVETVTAYETVRGVGGVDLRDHQVDIVTFTSSSTVTYFVERLKDEGVTLGDIRVACIGPKTAQTAQQAGFHDLIVPETYTLTGLLDAIQVNTE